MAPFSTDHEISLPVLGFDLDGPAPAANAPAATRTIGDVPTLVGRQEDQTTVTVTAESDSGGGGGGTNLSGGAIAGIVIGSVFGTLLLLWLIRSCFNLGAPPKERESWYRDIDTKNHHHHHSRQPHRHRRRRRSSSVSQPPPVVIRDSTGARQQPATYVYTDQTAGRGRRHSKGGY